MSVKETVLETLSSNRGTYISGEELSASLGVSRAAVWKAINALREEGFNIEAVTNKGYRLSAERQSITEESFRYALPQEYRRSSGRSFCKSFIYDSLDSTNLEAKRLLLDGKASSGCVVIANRQTAGRGRLGRSFFSPESGLYLSIIIKPDFDISKSVLVTVAAAAAVAKSIDEVCSQDARIKWVNDIYIDSSKVCGILTEAMTDFESGQIDNLVIGIGVNTSLEGFPEELKKTAGAVDLDRAASLGNVPGKTNAISLLASRITCYTLAYTAQIGKASPEFLDIYRDRSLVLGREIKVFKGAYRSDPNSELGGVTAKALGIDDDGGLQVIYTSGERETLTTGEVTIRL